MTGYPYQYHAVKAPLVATFLGRKLTNGYADEIGKATRKSEPANCPFLKGVRTCRFPAS